MVWKLGCCASWGIALFAVHCEVGINRCYRVVIVNEWAKRDRQIDIEGHRYTCVCRVKIAGVSYSIQLNRLPVKQTI